MAVQKKEPGRWVVETTVEPQPTVEIPKPAIPAIPKPIMEVNISWETMDVIEAQLWYGKLKAELERAGAILNKRTCLENEDQWTCFMGGKYGCCEHGVIYSRRPAGIDYAHKDPVTGLMKPARICSERCWVLYQKELIDARRAREIAVQQADT